MFLYFNKEGKLTTAIPHGEVPRQGNYLNIYVLLDLDFFDEKGEDYLDWALNVELAFPDGKLTIPFTQKEGPEQLEFRKVSDSEVTFDLVDGQEYLTYYFRFSPNQATANAGKIDALVSMQKTVNDLTNRGTGINIGLEDYVYLGKAEINIEKTFGYAKRIINESGSHFKNLMTTIANVDARKMNRADVIKEIDERSLNSEEVIALIEQYSSYTDELDIGTSDKYDGTREDQIPTSKAVKKEFDNLKENYMQLNGEKPMTGNLKMKGHNIIFDNDKEEILKIGEDDDGYSMAIRMEDSDYYKGRYRASGFSIGNDYIDAELDISESRFTMTFAGDSSSTITPSGFSVSKEGETFYEDGRIGRYLDNSFTKHVEIKLPNKSGELALNEDIPTKTSQLENDSGYVVEGLLSRYMTRDTTQTVSGNKIFEKPIYFWNESTYIQKPRGVAALEFYISDNLALSITKNRLNVYGTIGTESSYVSGIFGTNIKGKVIYQNNKQVANKEDIPTKVSQLDNDSGLITNAVDDLTNYYLKSETYTKSEVQQLLSTISSLKLEVVTNLPTTNISSNTIYLKPLDSAKENNIYEEYIYINSKWETIGTTAVDLSNYALKTDIPTKTSELTNDSNFLTKHQDISGKADKTELDNYLPYTTGIADSAKNIYWTTRLNSFQLDIESTKPSIEFYGDRVGSATITPNKIELTGYSEGGPASILLDGKPVALQENIPTKLSQLEEDVELGVSEEDVMGIIESNAEQTETLEVENATEIPIGTSATFDATSDEQIPTSKAVVNIISQYISSNFENGDEGSY